MARKPRGDKPALTPEQAAAQKAKRQKINRERFTKLAEKRTANAIRSLRNVARMSSKASYDYSADEAEQIVLAINAEYEKLVTAFTETNKKADGFTLKLSAA